MTDTILKIPEAPSSIQKGVPLKLLLDKKAIEQLGINIQHVHSSFDQASFVIECLTGIS